MGSQQTLGHATAGFTMTIYGHMFEDDLDALGLALDGPARGRSADSGPRVQGLGSSSFLRCSSSGGET